MRAATVYTLLASIRQAVDPAGGLAEQREQGAAQEHVCARGGSLRALAQVEYGAVPRGEVTGHAPGDQRVVVHRVGGHEHDQPCAQTCAGEDRCQVPRGLRVAALHGGAA